MAMVKEGRESDISILSEELLLEILCRLGSVKCATQCKSVNKLWCSLLNTDSHWLRRWHQMNPNKDSVTLVIQYFKAFEITPDYRAKSRFIPIARVNFNFLPCFSIGKEPVQVLGSHKDLLLCCPSFNDHSCYYICNPLTKQWTALPPPPPTIGEIELRCIKVPTNVEFIVDERAGGGLKFTVVRIIRHDLLPRLRGLHDGTVQVSVFSSDGGWREMDDSGGWREMFEGRRLCQKIVSYKGRLVWLMTKEYSEELVLYSWDLHSNCTRLPLIVTTNANRVFRPMSTIVVCDGCLRIAQFLDEDNKKLIVWQFDDSHIQEWDMLLELELELDFSRLLKDS